MRIAWVIVVLSIGCAGAVWAQTDGSGAGQASEARQETCRVTSGIVATAVSMRLDGAEPEQIKRAMTEGSLKVDDRYALAVAPLVEWVFTINDTIMGEPNAAQNVSGEFQRECVAFPG